jgi:hypothetical protein
VDFFVERGSNMGDKNPNKLNKKKKKVVEKVSAQPGILSDTISDKKIRK